MKKTRKIVVSLLALVLVFGAAACAKETNGVKQEAYDKKEGVNVFKEVSKTEKMSAKEKEKTLKEFYMWVLKTDPETAPKEIKDDLKALHEYKWFTEEFVDALVDPVGENYIEYTKKIPEKEYEKSKEHFNEVTQYLDSQASKDKK